MSNDNKSSKCLVITGGSKGIGLSTVERFMREGYRIINLSRSPIAIADATHIDADFAKMGWQVEAAARLESAIGTARSIVLVHNAALQMMGGTADVTAEQMRLMFEINVVAPSILTQLLLPKMSPGSAIIYVASTMGVRATRNLAGYVASKHALVGLMRSTCQDLAGSGIHTSCVCPGFTRTDMLSGFGGEVLKHLASLTTQNRLIEPAEIADAIYFAATNPALNGSILAADLGFIEP